MSSNMEDLLKKFSSNTNELLKFLEEMSNTEISKLSKKDRDSLLEQLELIEDITGKAESLSLKTKRDGVPALAKTEVAPKQKIENKEENKPSQKAKRPNLMKPTFNPNAGVTAPTKEKNKE